MDIEQHYRDNYSKLVASTLRRLGYKYRKRELAEEIVQEAYTRTMEYDILFLHSNGEGWFHKILNHCIADCMRRERTRGMTNVSDDALSEVRWADMERAMNEVWTK